jgi:hypothetical protein
LFIRKNLDFADGLLKLNIFYDKIESTAIYFRYYNELNYYVIKLNVLKKDGL